MRCDQCARPMVAIATFDGEDGNPLQAFECPQCFRSVVTEAAGASISQHSA